MKIFISWSGKKSQAIALVFKEWLPFVIQVVEPYVSSEDIDKGTRWSKDIFKELEASTFGIICVTKENVNAPWIQFEAGALSKSIETSRVCPFLFDAKTSDISDPFKQFQVTHFKKDDVKKLISSINNSCPQSLDKSRLETVFEKWWPELENRLNSIQEEFQSETTSLAIPKPQEENSMMDILEEILELTRAQHKLLSSSNKDSDTSYLLHLLDSYNNTCNNYELNERYFLNSPPKPKINKQVNWEMLSKIILENFEKNSPKQKPSDDTSPENDGA